VPQTEFTVRSSTDERRFTGEDGQERVVRRLDLDGPEGSTSATLASLVRFAPFGAGTQLLGRVQPSGKFKLGKVLSLRSSAPARPARDLGPPSLTTPGTTCSRPSGCDAPALPGRFSCAAHAADLDRLGEQLRVEGAERQEQNRRRRRPAKPVDAHEPPTDEPALLSTPSPAPPADLEQLLKQL
jgi:hypothetical protein